MHNSLREFEQPVNKTNWPSPRASKYIILPLGKYITLFKIFLIPEKSISMNKRKQTNN